jgi:hypothetical protein
VASLVRLPDFHAVELGLWSVAGEGLAGPPVLLLFEAEHVAKVRQAAAKAVRALPAATLDQEGMADLVGVDEGGLVCDLIGAPDGAACVTLAVADGSGVAEVPMEKADVLPRVLAAAERRLAEWGVVPLAGDLRN